MMEISPKLEGKKVRLTDSDNELFEGTVTDYIYPEDNEPEERASIIIREKKSKRSIEFLDTNIKSIEVISK